MPPFAPVQLSVAGEPVTTIWICPAGVAKPKPCRVPLGKVAVRFAMPPVVPVPPLSSV